MLHDEGYRACVRIKTLARNMSQGGKIVDATAVNYFGPWARAATAKAEVTKARKAYGKSFVDGWIEHAEWKRVE